MKCPLNPKLNCNECRLYIHIPYSKGARDCAFNQIASNTGYMVKI